jgi:hypothetical protein
VHELGHHWVRRYSIPVSGRLLSIRQEELICDSAYFAVCSYFGIETSNLSGRWPRQSVIAKAGERGRVLGSHLVAAIEDEGTARPGAGDGDDAPPPFPKPGLIAALSRSSAVASRHRADRLHKYRSRDNVPGSVLGHPGGIPSLTSILGLDLAARPHG